MRCGRESHILLEVECVHQGSELLCRKVIIIEVDIEIPDNDSCMQRVRCFQMRLERFEEIWQTAVGAAIQRDDVQVMWSVGVCVTGAQDSLDYGPVGSGVDGVLELMGITDVYNHAGGSSSGVVVTYSQHVKAR